tara:strand:- start:13862 stop:15409 length:1548 start_codon:yes stop_codon:yes gene_type:complete
MKEISFYVSPEQAKDESYLKQVIIDKLKLKHSNAFQYKWHKRSIDARKKNIRILCTFHVYFENDSPPLPYEPKFRPLDTEKEVHIIGLGPAGIFAALSALELGMKPIVYERGKAVKERIKDIGKLNRKGIVNGNSNYCYGEGGAGTYSDGKLYTRSKKRGAVRQVLETFVYFGANDDILVEAHPHIGTNKLPRIVSAMSDKIVEMGGEIHFNQQLTDLAIENNRICSITLNEQNTVTVANLVLATGHSARDIFELLHSKGIHIEAKPFALGVRVEHSQEFIDKAQYHGSVNDDYLPPASYRLVTQAENKGVYSFCMCPGGIIAPCATSAEEVVTNGWSPSKRNNPYANSGIVVSIEPEDLENPKDPFCGIKFQKKIERKAWELAGKNQKVPAQCLADFIHGKKSTDFPRSSYQPGITSIEMDDVFPEFITRRLRKAFIDFNKKVPGFISNDAVLHAPESRTSSPVLIPRNKETYQHINIKNLYPCAEGAGYAGGIVSAAIDGINCIQALHEEMES